MVGKYLMGDGDGKDSTRYMMMNLHNTCGNSTNTVQNCYTYPRQSV